MRRLILAATFAAAAGACSSAPKPDPEAFRAATVNQTGIIVAHARKLREEKGCAAAAPALRVAAAMGEGQESAQHELGECLMAIEGASAAETALFRDEGLFWLTRAAYAGNARAQRALAVSNGAASASEAARADALKWALVYEKNPEAGVLGYKALPETFIPGLRNGLPAESVAEAESFAASFVEIHLAAYTAAPIANRGAGPGGPQGGPPGGGQRRRR